jgi:hypothetical protein
MTSKTLTWPDAVLSGFGLVAHRPGPALSWALIFILSGTIMAGFQVWAWQGLDADLGLSTVAVRLGFAGFALGVLAVTIVCAGVLRAMVRPNDRNAAWPRLGGDELRLSVFTLTLMLAAGLISAVIAGLSYSMLGRHGDYRFWMDLVTRSTTVMLTLLGARLAVAAPMTVADRRLRLRSALDLSPGLHGRLAAILVAALLLSLAIEWAGSWARDMLLGAIGAAQTPVLKSASLPATLNAAFGPVAMSSRIVGAIVHALAFAVQIAPLGYVFRRLAGDPIIDRAAAFD